MSFGDLIPIKMEVYESNFFSSEILSSLLERRLLGVIGRDIEEEGGVFLLKCLIESLFGDCFLQSI